MKKSSIFEGVYVVAKFFSSKAPDGKMNCISRTLGKFSVINHASKDKVKDQEVWVCKIVKEIKPGKNQGTFILEPVERVKEPTVQLRKVIPGFYDLQTVNHAAIITPNTDPGNYWVLSKATRQIFSDKYYCVVVPIAYQEAAA